MTLIYELSPSLAKRAMATMSVGMSNGDQASRKAERRRRAHDHADDESEAVHGDPAQQRLTSSSHSIHREDSSELRSAEGGVKRMVEILTRSNPFRKIQKVHVSPRPKTFHELRAKVQATIEAFHRQRFPN